MSKKERFIAFVYFLSIARDLEQHTGESQRIGAMACAIAPRTIPKDVMRAARQFVQRFDSPEPMARWMTKKEKL